MSATMAASASAQREALRLISPPAGDPWRAMFAQPACQLQSTALVTPLLRRFPSHYAAHVVWSLSEQLVRTTLASPPLLCAALGPNIFPVGTNTSAIHDRLLQVRRAEKPRGSQKEAGSAALRHSGHCFFQSVRGALGSRPRWIFLRVSHCQSPVASSRTCIRPWRPDLDDRGRSPAIL